jgi:hypothetical protein
VSHFQKRHEFVSAIALLVACTFSTSCTAWHTIPLQPQRFSADTSPEWARLTLSNGTQKTVSHPVLVGDSLVWVDELGATPRDSARSAVLTSSIQRAEVSRVDAVRSIALLAVLGGMAVGVRALIISWANSLGGGN